MDDYYNIIQISKHYLFFFIEIVFMHIVTQIVTK